MKDTKLKRLFDYQKFEGNSAMNFAIQSARGYIDSLKNLPQVMELEEEELDMINAAGTDTANFKALRPEFPEN